MSEAEIASERPEMNRKIVLGSAMTNCFPFTEGKPENLSTVINQRKRFSARIVCQGCGANWWCCYSLARTGSSVEGAAFTGDAKNAQNWVTQRALAVNARCLLSLLQIIASILCPALKLMKNWLRPAVSSGKHWAWFWACLTDGSHRDLTDTLITVFQVHEEWAVLAYEGEWLAKHKAGTVLWPGT